MSKFQYGNSTKDNNIKDNLRDNLETTTEKNLALKKRSSFMRKRSKFTSIPVVVWNNLMECDEECVISDSCSDLYKDVKCVRMREYFDYVLDACLKTYGSYMNEKIMIQIGMHIMPMYSQLFKLKTIESSLLLNQMMSTNKQGTLIMHPVYKEIRQTINSIDTLWNRVGSKSLSVDDSGEDYLSGDNSYTDVLGEIVNE